MSNKKSKSSKKIYLLGIGFVMLINIGLVIFMIQTIFAQTSDERFKDQPPIVAEVAKQSDSPLLITIINIDNSNTDSQLVNYSVQNVNNKSVRAFTVSCISKSTGKIITRYLTFKLFQPREVDNGQIAIERFNIKSDETLSFSIDYIEFEDGSSWGNNIYKQSEKIAGERAGRQEVISKIKGLISSNNSDGLSTFFEQDLSTIDISKTISDKTDLWRSGFQFGYKSTIFSLQRFERQNIKELSAKLNEMEKLLK